MRRTVKVLGRLITKIEDGFINKICFANIFSFSYQTRGALTMHLPFSQSLTVLCQPHTNDIGLKNIALEVKHRSHLSELSQLELAGSPRLECLAQVRLTNSYFVTQTPRALFVKPTQFIDC